ncbi:hypothetical protein A9X77_08400 [Brachyspira hyodysenteriae]|uniref:tetratricopeptide repeat protein n=1 Tax=Brachyspira hyodysenteriae TaxID=159 RepID=UPI00063DC1BF|nr:tetratricopeptide repeat protein [Brachyspira hyodysenteriae]KLI27633.1 hypothetical protein SR30_01355 [Brachyspira hyodysenteriae]TVL76935.1 hypothetical protein A9X77_08400 [Brachyspira hyodysenteriae]TVL87469.1 hypothetical protein A9X78_10415 [Brachyspira hyodysenteriae]
MKSAEEYFYDGNKLYEQKKYDEAIICYEKSIDIVPKENTYIRLAGAYREKKCFYKSLESFLKALKLNPNSTYAYIGIGNLYLDNRYYEESIAYYNKTIELIENKISIEDSNLINSYYNRGLAYYHLRLYDKAEKDFFNVIDKNPEDYLAYIDIGNVYSMLDRHVEAIKYYNKAIEFCTKYNNECDISNIYNNLGIVYRKIKDYKKSNDYFDKSISKYNNDYAYINRGINHRILKEYNDAKKCYETVLVHSNYIDFSYKLFYSVYRLFNDGGIDVNEYNKITSKIIKESLSKQDEYIEIVEKDYKLYNYTKINKNTIRTTLNNELWLSHPNVFNDPIDPVVKQLNENSGGKFQYLIDSIVIGCLSLTNDNSLMWSHYADKHEGICIEYNFNNFFQNKPDDIILKKVSYVNDIIIEKDSILTSKSNNENNIVDILSTKSIEWKYENEYRVIKYYNDDKNNTIQMPIKNIYFGAKIPKDDRDFLIKILNNKNIGFYQANFDNTKLNKIVFNHIII